MEKDKLTVRTSTGMMSLLFLAKKSSFLKEIIATFLVFFTITNLSAQNLVPNYSFETYTSCPSNFSQIDLAASWFQTTIDGTSDFIHCCSNPSNVGVPENVWGSQTALTGGGYAGFYSYINSVDGEYSEYLTAPLTSPLTANACYYGEMYISLGETVSSIAVDKLGMYITNGVPVANANFNKIIAAPAPQIFSNAIISETDNWVQVSGVFVADGGETHITLGQFFPFNEVNQEDTGLGIPGVIINYNYVENVSLIEINESTLVDYAICDGACITIGSEEFCNPGTFTVNIPECANGISSFTVNITAQGSEQIVIEPVTELDCSNNTTTLDASGSSGLDQATSYGWTGPSNFSSPEAIVNVSTPGWYVFSINASCGGCSAIDSVEVTGNAELPDLSIEPIDNWDCVSPNITITGSSNTPGVNYQWTGPGTNATTPSVAVNQTGVYQLLVTSTNGCTAQGALTIPEGYFSLPTANVSSTGDLDCQLTEVDLIGSTDVTSATYLWSGPGVNETTLTATTNQPGVYNFTVTATSGCSATAQIEVFENTNIPDVSASPLGPIDCSTGSIELGGSSTIDNPFYTWTGPNTYEELETISVNTPGTYTFTVLDTNNGCSSNTAITLTAEELSTPTFATIVEPDEIGCINSEVVLSGSTDVDNPSYLWTGPDGFNEPFQTTSTSLPGLYTFIVTTANGCSVSEVVEVIGNVDAPDLLISSSGILGCNNPEIVLVGSTSVSNSQYEWQTPTGSVFNDSLLVSAPGLYILEITNLDNNCTTIDAIDVTADLSTPTSDAGEDGVLDCTNTEYNLNGSNSSGGNLTYSWLNSNDIEIGTSEVLPVSITGTYTLIVTNQDNGCSATDQVIVTQDSNVPISDAGEDGLLDCTNTEYNLNGSNSSGGNLTYSWLNSDDIEIGTTEILPVSITGTYTLVVTNQDNGCSATDQVIVTQDSNVPTSDAGEDGLLDCSNTEYNLNGSNSSGGNLTYSWLNSDDIEIGTSEVLPVSITGTYTLIVTNEDNGCSATDQVIVTQDSNVPISDAGEDGLLDCTNTEYSLNGSNSSGGNLVYSWLNSNDIEIGTSEVLPVSITGTYTLVVTNQDNGCSATDEVIVTQDSNVPTSDAGEDGLLDCTNTEYSLNGSNSSGGNLTYSWLNSDNVEIGTSEVLPVSITGTYTLVVTNQDNGCSATDEVVVTQDANVPTSDAGEDGLLDCSNTEYNLNGSNSSGGNLIYSWLNSDDVEIGTSEVLPVSITGTYTLVVTNQDNGCSATDQVIVTQDSNVPISDAGEDGLLDCSNTEYNLNGSNSSGGNLAYSWLNSDDVEIGTSEVLPVSITGTYTLIVTNEDNGCSATDQVIVTQDSNVPISDAGEDGLLDCTNTEYNLNGSNSSGGNLTYSWLNSNDIEIGTSEVLPVSITGTYTLIVTNQDNGCSATDQVIVTQDSNVPISDAGEDGLLDCSNTEYNLNGSNSSGGNLIYSWLNSDDIEIGTSEVLPVSITGTYTLVVTNQDNGCSATDQVIVTQDSNVPTSDAGEDGLLDCTNTEYILDGSNSSGGNLTYSWLNSDNVEIGTSEVLPVSITGTYTLIVTNEDNGCSATDQVIVTQDSNVPISDAGEDGLLDCTNTEYSLNGSNSSGGNLTYSWLNSDDVEIGTSEVLPVSITGTYTLIVTNEDNGCSATDQVIVTQDSNVPISDAGEDGLLDCSNTEYNLNGSNSSGGNLTYSWLNSNDVEIGTTEILSVSITGTYTLVVTNEDNGCSSTDQVIVTQDSTVPTSDAGEDGLLDCSNTEYNLNGSNSSGGNLTYSWLNSDDVEIGTSEVLPVSITGTYTLVVTNQDNGCSATDQVIVTQDSNVPTSDAGEDGLLDCTNTEYSLNGSNSSGGNLTYSWLNSDNVEIGTSEVLPVSITGTYTLVVTNQDNGCSATDEVIVTQDSNVPTSDAGVDGLLDCTNTEYSLNGSNSSGGNLTYSWLNSDDVEIGTSEVLPVSITGTYTLVVTNQDNGCSSTDQVIVTQDSNVPTSDAGEDGLLDCTNTEYNLNGSNSSGGNLTYSWLNSDDIEIGTTEILPVSITGTYTLVVTNQDNGCSATDQVIVTQDSNVPISDAGEDGLLDCTNTEYNLNGSNSSGGNLVYSWLNSDDIEIGTSEVLPVSITGTYTLIVTNEDNGCSATDQVIVTQDSNVPISDAGEDGLLDCSNTEYNLNGSNSSGGNLVYSWLNSDDIEIGTSEVLPVSITGTYTLIVTNEDNGCSATDQVIVTQDSNVPTSDAGEDGLLDCTNTEYSLNGSNSSGGNLVYSWLNSDDIEIGTSEVLPVSITGTYTLIVTNEDNGCSATDQVIVTQDSNVPTSDAGEDGLLDCTNTEYSLNGSNSSGGNLTYSWLNSDNVEIGTSEVLPVSITGTYTLVVTNEDNGCSATDQVIVTQDSNVPTSDAGEDGLLDCTNTEYSLNGSNSSGGNLTYSWLNSDNVEIGTSELLPVSITGTYTLIVTNEDNGCSATDQVIVTQDSNVPISDAGEDGLLDCSNTEYNLNGSNSSGGNLTYSWLNSDDVEIGTSEVLPVSITGTYTLVVTNQDNGCSATDQVIVTQDSTVPTSDAGEDGLLDCTNTEYSLNGSNSSGGNLTYSWLNSDDVEIGTSEVLPVSITGTYTLIVINEDNGCSSTDQVIVTQDSNVPISDAGEDGLLDCSNTEYNLNGSNSSGGNLTYSWLNSDDIEIGTSEVLPVSITGTYTLVVTNQDNGCSATDQVIVTQDSTVPTSDAGEDGLLDCTNTEYSLNGSNSSGGNLTYSWLNSDNVEIGTSELLPVSITGTYTLIVTNEDNGCSATDQVIVTQDSNVPISDAGEDGLLDCSNTEYNLNGSNSSGGNLTYSWLNSDDIEIGTTELLPVSITGTYTLIVTNEDNGCSATDQVIVTQDSTVPTSDAGEDGLLDCTNTEYNLNGSNSSGGNLTYSWLNSDDIEIGTTELLPVSITGTYTLIVTNEDNGCSATDQVIVTQDSNVPISDAGEDGLLDCTNTEYSLNGSNSSGGNLTYSWLNSDDVEIGTTEVLPVSIIGTYTLVVTNQDNGCSSTDQVIVTQDSNVPTSDAGVDGLLDCTNTEYNLNGSNSSGGNLTYSWLNSDDIEIGTSEVLPVSITGTYTLIVTNQDNGCSSTDQVIVTQDSNVPTSDAGEDGLLDCTNTEYSLNGSNSSGGNLTYSWLNSDDIEIGTSEVLPVSITGTYTLVVTNQDNGCSSTDEVIVTQDISLPTADAGMDGTITCAEENYLLDANNSTGDNLTYEWYNSAGDLISSNSTFTVSNSGDYTLIVINQTNGCTATDELSVFENTANPLAIATSNGVLTCEEEEVTLSGSASSATDIDFAWFDQNGQLIGSEMEVMVSNAGTYNLLITDLINGCQQTDVVTVLENIAEPLAVATTIVNLTCDEEEAALISGQGSSIGSEFIYEWTGPGMIQESTEIETAVNTEGLFLLQVTNTTNGCTATAQTEVSQSSDFPGLPELSVAGPYCHGGEATLIISEVTGGSPPYLYSINGGERFESSNFFTNLSAGSYEVLIEDSDGCLYEEDLIITEPEELFIDLQPTINVEYGEMQQLNAVVNLAPSEIASIQWTPTTGLSCTDCLSPNIISANQTIRYAIVVRDINGCLVKAEIRVEVIKNQAIYIPSAFSPNDDGDNDKFIIFSGENTIREINLLRVFDRWGAVVFEGIKGQANDPTFSWDGTKNGEKFNPGVFVYVAEVVLNDGRVALLKGDVTLME